jgi:hypothetical protein
MTTPFNIESNFNAAGQAAGLAIDVEGEDRQKRDALKQSSTYKIDGAF